MNSVVSFNPLPHGWVPNLDVNMLFPFQKSNIGYPAHIHFFRGLSCTGFLTDYVSSSIKSF